MIKYILKNPEWVYRVVLLAGVIGGICLKTSFVTLEKHNRDIEAIANTQISIGERLGRMETAFLLMQEQNKVNERQDRELADHEARIRMLETQNNRSSR